MFHVRNERTMEEPGLDLLSGAVSEPEVALAADDEIGRDSEGSFGGFASSDDTKAPTEVVGLSELLSLTD